MWRRRPSNRQSSTRVLILLENLPLERDNRVRRQCASLLENGYDVTVVCPRRTWRRQKPADPSVRVYSYPRPNDASGALGYVAEYAYSLLSTALIVAWLAATRGFDIIQACNPPDFFWLVAAPYRRFGKRYVFDHHDLSPELFCGKFGRGGMLYRLQLWLERMAVKLADVVITTNTTMQDIVSTRTGVAADRFVVVRNGPLLEDLGGSPHRDELKAGREWLTCWHGVMGEQDGVDLAIEAAAIVVNELGRRDCTFAFIGDGEMRANVERLAGELGVSDWVVFPGWLEYTELSEYLATADVGLSPDPPGQHMDWSTPIKAIEYMGFGVPVVGFDRDEQVASVDGGGVFVSGDSPAALAAEIDRLLDDPGRREQLGKKGRERVENGLAWDHQVVRYLDLYAGLGNRERRG